MDLSAAYELHWLGGKPRTRQLTATLQQVPGGFQIWTEDGRPIEIFPDDERGEIIDDERQGVVEFRMPDVRIILNKIGTAEWEKLAPFYPEDAADVETVPEITAYLKKRIEAATR